MASATASISSHPAALRDVKGEFSSVDFQKFYLLQFKFGCLEPDALFEFGGSAFD